MFKIYDLNMKELPFPEGVKPLDIFVSSVNKRRLTEEFEGRSGTLNYGYDYGERSVDLSLWLEAHDTIDYRLIRNELYAFFDAHDVFYVEETRVPSRVLKVTIDESYIPDRINQTHSSVEISCRTLDSVFWESKYTTLELHDSGYSATAEKYGLVDNIDDEKVEYRFEPQNAFNPNLIPLNEGDWENGSRWSSGTNNNNSNDIRLKMGEAIPIVDGRRYTIYDGSTYNSRIKTYMVHCFDDEGSMTYHFSRNRGATFTFTARGTKLVIALVAMDGYAIPLDYIEGDRVRLKLEEGDSHTGFEPSVQGFTVYNAGNVTVEPENMMLNIFASRVQSDGNFTIRNKTTGEEIILQRSSNGSHFRINGMVMSLGSITNIFRDTNRRFISLAPGNNEIEVTNGTFDRMDFDFKYLYK